MSSPDGFKYLPTAYIKASNFFQMEPPWRFQISPSCLPKCSSAFISRQWSCSEGFEYFLPPYLGLRLGNNLLKWSCLEGLGYLLLTLASDRATISSNGAVRKVSNISILRRDSSSFFRLLSSAVQRSIDYQFSKCI